MYVAGYPDESITFLLVVGVFKFASVFGLLSMLSSLLRSANGRMTSGQLVKSSKIDVDSQDRIWLLLILYR